MRTHLVVILLVVAAACGDSKDERSAKQPDTLVTEFDQVAMDKAIAEARATIDEFKTHLATPEQGDHDFYLKVKIEDGDRTEHFWLSGIAIEGDNYAGRIDNQSGDVKSVKLGQRYEFGFADVSDWMYRNEVGVMQGCRTLRVLLADMPPDEAAQISASMGW